MLFIYNSRTKKCHFTLKYKKLYIRNFSRIIYNLWFNVIPIIHYYYYLNVFSLIYYNIIFFDHHCIDKTLLFRISQRNVREYYLSYMDWSNFTKFPGHAKCHLLYSTYWLKTLFNFVCFKVPAYILAQMVGATAASGTLRLLFNGEHDHFVGTVPAGSDLQSLVIEFIITFYLMFVISSVATDTRAVSKEIIL